MDRRPLLLLALVGALAACPATQPAKPVQVAATAVPKAKTPSPSPTATPVVKYAFTVEVKAPAQLKAGTATLLDGPWEAVPDAALTITRADTGRPLTDVSTGKTDATGHAKFEVTAPGGPVILAAKVGRVTLKRVYAIVDGGVPVIDPATTIVASYFATLKVGSVDALDRIDAPRAEVLATRARIKLEADPTGVDLATEASAAAAFQAMLDADANLAATARSAVGGTTLGDDPAR